MFDYGCSSRLHFIQTLFDCIDSSFDLLMVLVIGGVEMFHPRASRRLSKIRRGQRPRNLNNVVVAH